LHFGLGLSKQMFWLQIKTEFGETPNFVNNFYLLSLLVFADNTDVV